MHFQPRFFKQGEIILEEHEYTKEVLLVIDGHINCQTSIHQTNMTILQFNKGRTIIGDYSILANKPVLVDHVAKSKRGVHAIAIPKKPFLTILNNGFPDLKKELLIKAMKRENNIKEILENLHTDDGNRNRSSDHFVKTSATEVNQDSSSRNLNNSRTSLGHFEVIHQGDQNAHGKEKVINMMDNLHKEILFLVKNINKNIKKKSYNLHKKAKNYRKLIKKSRDSSLISSVSSSSIPNEEIAFHRRNYED